MIKKGSWFVFKRGDGFWHRKPMQVKAITREKDRVRTFRAIDGQMWIDIDKIRLATKEEIALNERQDLVEEGT